MYDDNTTPTWALLWSHGLVGGSQKGWAFIHVWKASDALGAYTHLANLAMVPECFASLTDKDGPLTAFLQWHAWQRYRWKPSHASQPSKPRDYDSIAWRYFEPPAAPSSHVRERALKLDNARLRQLRPIMERLGLL